MDFANHICSTNFVSNSRREFITAVYRKRKQVVGSEGNQPRS